MKWKRPDADQMSWVVMLSLACGLCGHPDPWWMLIVFVMTFIFWTVLATIGGSLE